MVVTAVVAGGLPVEREAAVAQACRLITTAARHDASLVAFLTTFAPGVIEAGGRRRLRQTAREARVHVALGYDRQRRQVTLLIDSMGNVLGERRARGVVKGSFSYETPFGRLGLFFPGEAAQALRVEGKTAIFVVMGEISAEMGQRIAVTKQASVIGRVAGEAVLFTPVRPKRFQSDGSIMTATDLLLFAELPAISK